MAPINSKELKLLSKAAGEFARKELAPGREENDKFPYSPFFEPVLEKAFELDFFHSILPEAYGGIGQGVTALSIVMENLCREDSSLGAVIFTCCAAHEILLSSNSEEKLKTLTGNGDKIADFLVAMPVFNDPLDMAPSLQAKKAGNGYLLSGRLEFLVLGGIAGKAIIPASAEGREGYTFFLVDMAEQGVDISEPVYSLGLHACPAVDITMNAVDAKIIGAEGSGTEHFRRMNSKLSAVAAAMSLGIMKGAFSEALDYCKKRSQGGRTIVNWSEVRMMLADMAIEIKSADMALSGICMAQDNESNGRGDHGACAVAMKIQETACRLTTDGIQVMGGVGYMKDFGQEKRFRDAKQLQSLFGMTPRRKLRYLDTVI